MRNTVLLFFIAFVTACAGAPTKSTYIQNQSPNSAKVQGSWKKESMTFWEGFSLHSVDDKFISNKLFGNVNAATFSVEPGQRKLVTHVKFSRGLRPGPFEAFVPINANLESAKQYQIKGNIQGDTVNAWLEDVMSNKRVSQISTSIYQQQGGTTVIPIIIPK